MLEIVLKNTKFTNHKAWYFAIIASDSEILIFSKEGRGPPELREYGVCQVLIFSSWALDLSFSAWSFSSSVRAESIGAVSHGFRSNALTFLGVIWRAGKKRNKRCWRGIHRWMLFADGYEIGWNPVDAVRNPQQFLADLVWTLVCDDPEVWWRVCWLQLLSKHLVEWHSLIWGRWHTLHSQFLG